MTETTTKRAAVDELTEVLDSKFFRALSEPVRIEILKFLMVNGRSDIGTIAGALPQDRSVISRHLNTMLKADLLSCIKEGRYCFYEVCSDEFLKLAVNMTGAIKRCIKECCPPSCCT